jgi:hypothetical protein
VTDGVAVIVFILENDTLPVIETDGDPDDVLEEEDDAVIVLVLYIVKLALGLTDIVDRLVDVFVGKGDLLLEAEDVELLDNIDESVSEGVCDCVLLAAADTVILELRLLEEDSVIYAVRLAVPVAELVELIIFDGLVV